MAQAASRGAWLLRRFRPNGSRLCGSTEPAAYSGTFWSQLQLLYVDSLKR